MTLFRATVLDTPDDPFRGGVLRAESDAGVLVVDGVIVERGPYADVRARHRDEPVVRLADGVLMPGFVDAHTHYPQVRVIGQLGLALLDWLDRCALPEEARLADAGYAAAIAREFVSGLVRAGTTTALVFGSHFPDAVDALFTEAARVGVRVAAGLVVSDRGLPDALLTTAECGYDKGLDLARRWHGTGRVRYAVTPRFTVSCSPAMLESCAALVDAVPGALFTTHLNENRDEIAAVRGLSGLPDYLATYEAAQLVGPHGVFAHNVHPSVSEVDRLARHPVRRWRTARRATSRSAADCSLSPCMRRTASGLRWGPTWAPAPASPCSRRAWRQAWCSRYSGSTASGSIRCACCGWPPERGRTPWVSVSLWATSASDAGSTLSGSGRRAVRRCTWR